MVLKSFSFPFTVIVVTDISIKNNIATSILYIHIVNSPLIKTLHYTAFVMSTEAELFVIRYSINQTYIRENISKIIVVTNFIHVAKKIFNLSLHSYQVHTVAILSDLCCFFASNQNNLIEFWKCSS